MGLTVIEESQNVYFGTQMSHSITMSLLILVVLYLNVHHLHDKLDIYLLFLL